MKRGLGGDRLLLPVCLGGLLGVLVQSTQEAILEPEPLQAMLGA